jgi:hypothetical protein
MVRPGLAAAVAALLGIAPLAAGAIEPARPLRTLTYSVDVKVVNTMDTPGGTVASGGTRPALIVKGRVVTQSRPLTGSGDQRSGASLATKGSITIDVIQATDDAGLVVDVAEDAIDRVRPKVRVAIAGDGALFYDPTNAPRLSEEEIAVIHWLGRGFYGDHPTTVGTSWIVDQSANGHTDVERYQVMAKDASHITLGYELEQRVTVSSGYSGTREGSLVYDVAMVVPVTASFESIARRQVGDSYDTLRTSVRLTLTADTFAKPNAGDASLKPR